MTRTLHEPWPKPKRPPSARDPPSQSAAAQKTAESISRKPYETAWAALARLVDPLFQVLGEVLVHLEHGYAVFAEHRLRQPFSIDPKPLRGKDPNRHSDPFLPTQAKAALQLHRLALILRLQHALQARAC